MSKLLQKLEIRLKKTLGEMNKNDRKKILSAFEFSKKAHEGHLRKSGEPLITHPLSVGLNLWDEYQDADLTIAGLLHDTVEDNPEIRIEEVYKKFGEEIGFIVDALNKRETGFYGKSKKFTDKTERLIWAGIKDVRVLIVKLGDRHHNLETIGNLPDNKQVRMTFETQAIYYPLKKIIENKNIQIAQRDLLSFIENKKLTTPQKIKEYLFNNSFKEFSNDLYGLVYDNTDKIIWEMNDLEWFEKMVKDKKLSKHIEIESMKTEQDGYFQLLFLFKKGKLLNLPGRLKALSIKE